MDDQVGVNLNKEQNLDGCARAKSYFVKSQKEKFKYLIPLIDLPIARKNHSKNLTSNLNFREKNLKLAKSNIHALGIFAQNKIESNEFIIEYVGEVIRKTVSDKRENEYIAKGIGSSFMFKIDQNLIIDATKCGNKARYINHSCEVRNSYTLNNFNIKRFT